MGEHKTYVNGVLKALVDKGRQHARRVDALDCVFGHLVGGDKLDWLYRRKDE